MMERTTKEKETQKQRPKAKIKNQPDRAVVAERSRASIKLQPMFKVEGWNPGGSIFFVLKKLVREIYDRAWTKNALGN